MSVRVRFAPSPTGPLHIGGVRTALYNFLFARHHGGKFILRIEDTDQQRYVEGAEKYIQEALDWLGLQTDESPLEGGNYGPYRQSERSEIYKKYVDELVEAGKAYYAFDTPEEIDTMKKRLEEGGVHSPKYSFETRSEMRNSLTLSGEEIQQLKVQGVPHVVRLKIEPDQTISFSDVVRGNVSFSSNELDDKVLMKSDGLPTYHLANVVDDHLMKISHVIRGEEWLSSTPLHVILYQSFGWEDTMPTFVHLPLILKPVGKGKLSKRDGAKFGFPVFPLLWNGEEEYQGFRESGYLPEAVINFLSLLGWNPGTEEEVMEISHLIQNFTLEKINKSGARFDVEKALWFNQQYITKSSPSNLYELLKHLPGFTDTSKDYSIAVIEQLQPRVQTLLDFGVQASFFYAVPEIYDEKNLRKKWKGVIVEQWPNLLSNISEIDPWNSSNIEEIIKNFLTTNELGMGAVFPLLRIAISGTLKGPDLFNSMAILGKEAVLDRLKALPSRVPKAEN